MISAKARKLQRDAEALEKMLQYDQHIHNHLGGDYDRTRRRNAFSTLPGFQEKPEMESVRLESVFLLKQFISTATNLFLNFLGGGMPVPRRQFAFFSGCG